MDGWLRRFWSESNLVSLALIEVSLAHHCEIETRHDFGSQKRFLAFGGFGIAQQLLGACLRFGLGLRIGFADRLAVDLDQLGESCAFLKINAVDFFLALFDFALRVQFLSYTDLGVSE